MTPGNLVEAPMKRRWTSIKLHSVTSEMTALLKFMLSTIRLARGFSCSGFATKIIYTFIISLMRATCPTHSTLPDVITLITNQLYQHEVRISIPWKHQIVTPSSQNFFLELDGRRQCCFCCLFNDPLSHAWMLTVSSWKGAGGSNPLHGCITGQEASRKSE